MLVTRYLTRLGRISFILRIHTLIITQHPHIHSIYIAVPKPSSLSNKLG